MRHSHGGPGGNRTPAARRRQVYSLLSAIAHPIHGFPPGPFVVGPEGKISTWLSLHAHPQIDRATEEAPSPTWLRSIIDGLEQPGVNDTRSTAKFFWHRLQESNPRQEVWKLLCYHYTKPVRRCERVCRLVPLATLSMGVALPAERWLDLLGEQIAPAVATIKAGGRFDHGRDDRGGLRQRMPVPRSERLRHDRGSNHAS
jgi:hypothetical protein